MWPEKAYFGYIKSILLLKIILIYSNWCKQRFTDLFGSKGKYNRKVHKTYIKRSQNVAFLAVPINFNKMIVQVNQVLDS